MPKYVNIPKPGNIFARDWEWSELTAFAADDRKDAGATLGVVSGRRRQGKTFLLSALAEAMGGFYFAATEATSTEGLHQLGAALGRFHGLSAPLHFTDWHEAVRALLALGSQRPLPVVIDEFPYLAKAAPELPSVIQAEYGPRLATKTASKTRLLLCGSAMAFMGRLLSGSAPLRGRAGLELVVHPLNYRQAAEFWEITDWRLAVLVHAVLGGTPAYRREFIGDDVPVGMDDFDAWICRTVLNPANPIHREARYLLSDEADLHDRSLYHSVLAAVASGNCRRSQIADYIGRKATDITHPMTVLQDCGLLTSDVDAFRSNRTTFRLTEPLITFDHAVVRPQLDFIARQPALRIWQRSQDTFLSKVVGPQFEWLCREWVLSHAEVSTFGGFPCSALSGSVADPAGKTSHEVDVVVRGNIGQDQNILLSIGEAKWSKVMGVGHLKRLRSIMALLESQGHDVGSCKPACYSGVGFTDELREAEGRGEVVLVDLERLYTGE